MYIIGEINKIVFKEKWIILTFSTLLLHFHTPRLDFHNPCVDFHTIQRSALYNIRCALTLDSVRLNRINSARKPNKHGSRTELTVYN